MTVTSWGTPEQTVLPIPLDSYTQAEESLRQSIQLEELPIMDVLKLRIQEEPFNLIASILFFCAIIHSFLCSKIHSLAHKHEHSLSKKDAAGSSFRITLLRFLGEIEAVFGIWVLPLFILITVRFSFSDAVNYIESRNYTEPMFVVVIMSIAASRPIICFARIILERLASLGKSSPSAWWISILIITPLLGSFITEPAAMTIACLLLGSQFYSLKPSVSLKYATLALLFVNVSVGGTLTTFAAPPVLMVSNTWNWTTVFMLQEFGWKASIGIGIATLFYYFIFRKQFTVLARQAAAMNDSHERIMLPVAWWVILVHVLFLAWTVFNGHHPVLFIGGYLFFLAFMSMTKKYQSANNLRGPILVGFFLAGLVIHGGLQAWWIEPILHSLGNVPLFAGATVLTAFNDNAAITYLASQVPSFAENKELQIAVVAGAVTGGGLTFIANAPNPAGQSILKGFFNNELSSLYLLLGAIIPTLIMALCFLFL